MFQSVQSSGLIFRRANGGLVFLFFVFLYVIRLRFSSRTCFTKAILQSSTASSLFQSDAFILYSLSVDYLVVEGQQRYYYSMTS